MGYADLKFERKVCVNSIHAEDKTNVYQEIHQHNLALYSSSNTRKEMHFIAMMYPISTVLLNLHPGRLNIAI